MKKLFTLCAVLIYAISTVFFCGELAEKKTEEAQSGQEEPKEQMTATDLGVLCINTAYPNMGIRLADSRDNEAAPSEESQKSESGKPAEKEEKPEEPVITGKDPLVLIVHTHATESYLPSSSGNFHSKSEKNTVRDVGNVLTETLEERGIPVVHDKTLHDNPSYNNSYNRSYETIQKTLKKYPTIKCVIDLHRDAVASGKVATVSVNGKSCAKYSYVVSTAVGTYESNLKFVKSLNATASEKYKGFTGKVLERNYRYNQDLSTKYLLLEIGYNINQIEDCRNTADIFGNILADTLKKDKK